MAAKPRVRCIDDRTEIEQLLTDLDAPVPLYGSTPELVVVPADEWRDWRAARANHD